MNSKYKSSQEFEFDLLDLFWKFLMQWKAILAVCLAMAILVTGVRYVSDSRAYDAALAERAEAEAESSLSVEERIAKITDALPQNDRTTVMYILRLQESIDYLNSYLNNSIMLNADPARQRNLNIKYYLDKGDVSDIQTLADAYSTCIRRSKVIKAFRDIISPDSPLEYIYELVTTWSGTIADSSADSTLFTVNIVLPEHADAEQIIKESDIIISDIHKEISSLLGEHSITRVNTEDFRTYAATAADRRTNLSYAINNLNNNLKNAKTGLTEQQLAALEAIDAVKKASEAVKEGAETAEAAPLKAPGFNKIFAILGFIFGLALYAICFLIISMLKKVISSASVAKSCTGTRLLGELYVFNDHKGISKLFSSKAVSKAGYKDKLDVDNHAEEAASAIDAVCSYHNTENLTLLVNGVSESLKTALDNVIKKSGSNGRKIKLDVVDADKTDEKMLSGLSNVAFAISNNSGVYSVGKMTNLCKEYGITPLGTVYLEDL